MVGSRSSWTHGLVPRPGRVQSFALGKISASVHDQVFSFVSSPIRIREQVWRESSDSVFLGFLFSGSPNLWLRNDTISDRVGIFFGECPSLRTPSILSNMQLCTARGGFERFMRPDSPSGEFVGQRIIDK